MPPYVPILRAQLRTKPSNGHGAFVPQLKKLVFEYCDTWSSSARLRGYLLRNSERLAQENPHVEVVVRQRPFKAPIVRGIYLNERDKVVPLNKLEPSSIEQKVQLLLDSSGAKIRPFKRSVESTTESARGMWSGFHQGEEQFKI
ncbi:unnamed protein product [Rhizoctonia solani]|uniref:Large ribosomal subunit protein mL43 n=1 Tax=Rhizoctonia solani TaxID=456999 RepID=A0A8H3BR49_9AGAM|nr:unnamed protein product [Rhizoctonia solani]CAE6475466.1 unnamed protein product [Rhizoctonia solani]